MATLVQRLDYIGSKYQLLGWITESIQQKTGWSSLAGKRIADLFAGTGIVSYHFRLLGSTVISNDRESYSFTVTKALTRSTYTESIKTLIETINRELQTQSTYGYITKQYSPYEGCERMFFTVDNAKKLDYVRKRIEELKPSISDNEYTFLLASLIVSADKVSNVPSVYGCYLKSFKKKAEKTFILHPIHTNTVAAAEGSITFNHDVLSNEMLEQVQVDIVYLDPPYNERQYSKNYFPLNILTKTPTELESEPPLKGKTGIPTDCFLSKFCRKEKVVEEAFDKLFKELKTKWLFLSYNSESIVSKQKILDLMGKYGTVSVIERDYKRFKSFEYNEDKQIKEYLFCLQKAV